MNICYDKKNKEEMPEYVMKNGKVNVDASLLAAGYLTGSQHSAVLSFMDEGHRETVG